MGTWQITSTGEMSPAMIESPCSPFFSALTTSLPPRRMSFAPAAASSVANGCLLVELLLAVFEVKASRSTKSTDALAFALGS